MIVAQNWLVGVPLITENRPFALPPRRKRTDRRNHIAVKLHVNRLIVLRARYIQHISRPVNHRIGRALLATEAQTCIQGENEFREMLWILRTDDLQKALVFAVLALPATTGLMQHSRTLSLVLLHVELHAKMILCSQLARESALRKYQLPQQPMQTWRCYAWTRSLSLYLILRTKTVSVSSSTFIRHPELV